jgi:hypothetical protein
LNSIWNLEALYLGGAGGGLFGGGGGGAATSPPLSATMFLFAEVTSARYAVPSNSFATRSSRKSCAAPASGTKFS